MKHLALVMLAACSNAADPAVDAFVGPQMSDGALDAALDASPSTAMRILVLNEVAPSETPDWFEVVNATTAVVQLADFAYVDLAGDFAKAKTFPTMTLAPGVRYVQSVDDVTSGFKLASDEELWIYRVSDHALSDGVDWPEGAAPAGKAYARSPDVFGPFVTAAQTRGTANP
jgi:hypothetical protein